MPLPTRYTNNVNINMAETFTYLVHGTSYLVDFPVYAVCRSVTYECEGHETRLSDCMSPLSSTIAPCYYALVKCFSTTDKRFGGSTTLLAVLLIGSGGAAHPPMFYG